MTNSRLTIATIPGDGIGNEVLPAATRVIDHAAAESGVSIDWNWLDWGCDYLVANGSMMPSDGIDRLSQSDAVFLGAVGSLEDKLFALLEHVPVPSVLHLALVPYSPIWGK